MSRLLRGKKAQNTAEYAIVISLVIAAVIGMRTYAQRGIQGRFKDAVDGLVDDTSISSTRYSDVATAEFALPSADVEAGKYKQLEPYYRKSDFTVERDTGETRKFGADTSLGTARSAEREIQAGGDVTERSGYQTSTSWED